MFGSMLLAVAIAVPVGLFWGERRTTNLELLPKLILRAAHYRGFTGPARRTRYFECHRHQ